MGSLLKLKTDLKSIKYGHDRANGGSSGQPYIQTDITTVDKGINRLRFGNFDEGLVRGGVIGMLNSSITDTLRIGKFLTDTPKGPLFIIKQVGLQLSNPRLETIKLSTPSSSGFLGSVAKLYDRINDKVGLGPTRLYNLGINTLAQVPINGIGGHIVRHGLLPVADPSKYYEAVVTANDARFGEGKNNRLVKLATKFGLGNPNYKEVSGGNKLIIDDYIGGPGSVYGIGTTLINRAKNRDTSDNSRIRDAFNYSEYQAGKTRISGSSGTGVAEVKIKDTKDFKISNITGSIYNPTKFDNSKYPELDGSFISNIAKGITNFNLKIYNTIRGGSENDVINSNGSYTSTDIGTINYQNTYGEVVTVKKPNWDAASREIRVGSSRQDQINLTPIFEAEAGTHVDTVNIPGVGVKNINDLVKFRIQAIDTDTPSSANWMIFRAYLTAMSDSVDATWNEVKYAGRGDKFYIYDGFSRKMSVSFKVAALSAEEMQPMYQKLNYLMSNLMPDYSNNLMRGPLVRMTIGNYIDGQLCKLDSVSYTIPQDSPWEISLGSQYPQQLELNLPHIIEVQLSFTPIGSQTRDENRLSRKTEGTSNIAQNWNAKDEKGLKEYIYTPEPKSKSKVDQSNGIKKIEPKEVKAPPATIRTTGIPFVSARNAISTRNPFAPF
jgi:hypothetical protein